MCAFAYKDENKQIRYVYSNQAINELASDEGPSDSTNTNAANAATSTRAGELQINSHVSVPGLSEIILNDEQEQSQVALSKSQNRHFDF